MGNRGTRVVNITDTTYLSRRNKIEPLLYSIGKNQFQMIKSLNVNNKTFKILIS